MSAELLELEQLTLRAWPALDEQDHDPWRLRAAQGHTDRANAAAPPAAGRLDLATGIAHCEQCYAARGCFGGVEPSMCCASESRRAR